MGLSMSRSGGSSSRCRRLCGKRNLERVQMQIMQKEQQKSQLQDTDQAVVKTARLVDVTQRRQLQQMPFRFRCFRLLWYSAISDLSASTVIANFRIPLSDFENIL